MYKGETSRQYNAASSNATHLHAEAENVIILKYLQIFVLRLWEIQAVIIAFSSLDNSISGLQYFTHGIQWEKGEKD